MITSLVLTRPLSKGNMTPVSTGVATSVINGQTMPTFPDPQRANKILSIAEQIVTFSRNQLSNLDWLRSGNTSDADSGIVMDFDGTICYVTGHCEDAKAGEKDIRLFINGIDTIVVGTITPGPDSSFVDTNLNVDFNQGDKIRLMAVDSTGSAPIAIQDTVVKLTIKWRST